MLARVREKCQDIFPFPRVEAFMRQLVIGWNELKAVVAVLHHQPSAREVAAVLHHQP